MDTLTKRVIPVFAVNAFFSLVGFALSIAHFGVPHVWLHPALGTLWTGLLFAQMILAAKHHPAHKIVGRVALVVLGVSIYAALYGMTLENPRGMQIPASRAVVFIATGFGALIFASIGVALAVNKKVEAHSTAMLLAGAVTMAAGIARFAGALDAIIGIPFALTYAASMSSMAAVLWLWRPGQIYLIGSFAVLMGCVIFMR